MGIITPTGKRDRANVAGTTLRVFRDCFIEWVARKISSMTSSERYTGGLLQSGGRQRLLPRDLSFAVSFLLKTNPRKHCKTLCFLKMGKAFFYTFKISHRSTLGRLFRSKKKSGRDSFLVTFCFAQPLLPCPPFSRPHYRTSNPFKDTRRRRRRLFAQANRKNGRG